MENLSLSLGINITLPEYVELFNLTYPLLANILIFPFAFTKVVGALCAVSDVNGLVLKSPAFKYRTDFSKPALSASFSWLLKFEIL